MLLPIPAPPRPQRLQFPVVTAVLCLVGSAFNDLKNLANSSQCLLRTETRQQETLLNDQVYI